MLDAVRHGVSHHALNVAGIPAHAPPAFLTVPTRPFLVRPIARSVMEVTEPRQADEIRFLPVDDDE